MFSLQRASGPPTAAEAPGAPIAVQARRGSGGLLAWHGMLHQACPVPLLSSAALMHTCLPSRYHPSLPQMAAREHVLAVLRDCFQRHGAVAMASQELGLAGEGDPLMAVQLLTPAGTKLSLRYEMRTPFAAWLMQQLAAAGQAGSSSHSATLLLDGLRRYEIAEVQVGGWVGCEAGRWANWGAGWAGGQAL